MRVMRYTEEGEDSRASSSGCARRSQRTLRVRNSRRNGARRSFGQEIVSSNPVELPATAAQHTSSSPRSGETALMRMSGESRKRRRRESSRLRRSGCARRILIRRW